MGLPNGPDYILLCEILRIGSRAELLPSQVDRVGPCGQRSQKGFSAPRGSQ